MSKEPIQLGHSVERHEHHDSSHHHSSPSEDDLLTTRRENREFGADELNPVEQILVIILASGMIIGFLAIVLFVIFR